MTTHNASHTTHAIHNDPMHPPPQENGGIIFCLREALLWRTLVRGGGYMGGILFFVLGMIIRWLVVSIHPKENLPVVNFNYLLMT